MGIGKIAGLGLAGLVAVGGVAGVRAQPQAEGKPGQSEGAAAQTPGSPAPTQGSPAGSEAGQPPSQTTPGQTEGGKQAAGDPAQGQKYFEQAGCGWCHAEAGRVAGKGPKLEGTARSDSFIMFRVKHGKEGAMPAFGATFNDKQITDIIAYIRSLKG